MKKYTTAPHRKLLISFGLIGFGLMIATAVPVASATAEPKQAEIRKIVQSNQSQNKEIVRVGFAKWANNTGSIFDLLADDAEWTITGRSPISKTYTSRKQFLEEAIVPINERLSARIVPSVRGIYAEGDTVIALWDGTATAKDGKPYTNTYSWYMTMKNGRIVKVVAFFDTIELTDLWQRIPVSKKN
ncbi:nuclear transport factor 2 family protein [Nostoc sp. XA010]|uniref:nuclear transport factor 2 family protein n=1 Tax=Nostoc sp. XA010 TaxID=2780407 RepID=UPI001E4DDD64|nr:nuclear transport factor 2 family protein [Nostoc sp. XA010]MCC5661416.1 nuclear transport factor 2 family protein [Nostoc sp. XA010]